MSELLDVDWIKKAAKQNLMNDGHILALVFIETAKGILVYPTPFADDEEKVKMLSAAAYIAKQENATNIVFISEVSCRTVVGKEAADFVRENYDTERPSAYPKSMRTEAIFIGHTDCVNNTCDVCLIPYDKCADGYVFGEEETSVEVDGFLSNMFLKKPLI